jgi:hypothetical protein
MNLNLPGDWQLGLEISRVVFLVLDLVLFLGVVYFWRRGLKMRPVFTWKVATQERHQMLQSDPKVQAAWKAVKAKLGTNPPASYVLTIIEADTFVDDILKRLGLVGETMMERLNQLEAKEFFSLEDLRRVHRIRNALVHRPGFSITENQAVEMMEIYEKFLDELGLV